MSKQDHEDLRDQSIDWSENGPVKEDAGKSVEVDETAIQLQQTRSQLFVREVQLNIALGLLSEVMPRQIAVKMIDELTSIELQKIPQVDVAS